MEKIKQNKNTSVVYKVASATLASIVLFISIAIPSFAVDSSFSNTLPVYTSTSTPSHEFVQTNGMLLWTTSAGNQRIGMASVDDMSAFVTTVSGTEYLVFIRYGDANRNRNIYHVNTGNNYNTTVTTMNRVSNDSTSPDYLLYIGSYATGTGSTVNPAFPVYSSEAEGIAAYKSYLEQSSVTPQELDYNIAPGYALFIDIHGLSGIQGNLSTTTSKAFASPHTSNQTLSYQNALPSGNVSPQGNGISWQGIGNKDLFGRYKSWSSTLIPNNYNYIAIYNPVHIDTYVDPEHEDFNGTISVHVNKAYSETTILIPLNTELTGTGTVGTVTTEDQKPVVYDETTGTWIPTNQDGTPYTPSPYGDYLPSTTNSIHDWLQNIANLISGFFNGAIGAVTTLVGAGSAFINQLVSLYSWLPAPVYAVLSSALILVITIGVIKVFI